MSANCETYKQSIIVFGQEFLWISGWTVFDKLAIIFLPGTHVMQFLGILCLIHKN